MLAQIPIQFVICLLAAAGLAGYGGTRFYARQGTLLRLRDMLGAAPEKSSARHALFAALGGLGIRIPGASDKSLKALLMGAGYFQTAALPVFIASRLIVTAALFSAVLMGHGAAMQAHDILLALFAAFFCSRLFVIALKIQAESRQRAIRRELPPVIDVLLMVLNSGVSIDQCLHYVTGILEYTAPLSNSIFKRYIADVDGGMPYEAAFERMGQRLGIEEGYDLANLISQALLQGGEIMVSLERFGADVTEKRVAASREQIGRKSIYLTIVMLACFMPVLLITLAGPAVSNIVDTLRTVKHHMHQKTGR